MKKILMISGSRRKDSFNTEMARIAAGELEGKAETEMLSWMDVPFFSQDDEFPVPEAVENVRRICREADAVWFFTPEYNGQLPGGLKNLLDWLSRPVEPQGKRTETPLYGKPCTISGSGGRRAAALSRKQLEELAGFLGMKVMKEPEAGIALSGEAFQTGKLTEGDIEEMKKALKEQAYAFLHFIQG